MKSLDLKHTFLRGMKYAAYFVIIGGAMGIVYGLFGGNVVSPAVATVSLTGVFVVLNFIVAIIISMINLILYIFRASPSWSLRYIIYSTAFLIVFMLFFALLHLLGIEVF